MLSYQLLWSCAKYIFCVLSYVAITYSSECPHTHILFPSLLNIHGTAGISYYLQATHIESIQGDCSQGFVCHGQEYGTANHFAGQ